MALFGNKSLFFFFLKQLKLPKILVEIIIYTLEVLMSLSWSPTWALEMLKET